MVKTCTWISFMLEESRVFFSLLFFPVTVSCECFNLFTFILRGSVGLLWFFFGILHWELVHHPAKIDTLAHARCLTAVHARSLLFCFAALFPIILDKLVRSKLKKRKLLDYGMAWRWVSTQFFVSIKMRENNGMKSSLFMVASRNSPEKTLQRHRNVGRSALHYEYEKLEIIITLKLKYNTVS